MLPPAKEALMDSQVRSESGNLAERSIALGVGDLFSAPYRETHAKGRVTNGSGEWLGKSP